MNDHIRQTAGAHAIKPRQGYLIVNPGLTASQFFPVDAKVRQFLHALSNGRLKTAIAIGMQLLCIVKRQDA